MTDRAVVICTPTSRPPSIKDCTREHCMVCATEVWVSPSTRLIVESPEFLCIDCAPGVAATQKDFTIQRPSQAQLDEIRRNQ